MRDSKAYGPRMKGTRRPEPGHWLTDLTPGGLQMSHWTEARDWHTYQAHDEQTRRSLWRACWETDNSSTKTSVWFRRTRSQDKAVSLISFQELPVFVVSTWWVTEMEVMSQTLWSRGKSLELRPSPGLIPPLLYLVLDVENRAELQRGTVKTRDRLRPHRNLISQSSLTF